MKCNDISPIKHPRAPYPAETDLSFDVEQHLRDTRCITPLAREAISCWHQRGGPTASTNQQVRAQGHTFAIRADDLNTIAALTFDNMLKERYDALWQNVPVNPRTCPSELQTQKVLACAYAGIL